MPSFKTLSMIATFALAAFTAASPMPAPEPVADLVVRGGPPPKSVPKALIDLEIAIKPLCVEIDVIVDLKKPLVKADIEIVIGKIKVAVDVVIELIKGWKDYKDHPDCLYHDGKHYSHAELAHLLFGIISIILVAIFKLLKYAGLLGYLIYKPLCIPLLAVIHGLLEAVVLIVGTVIIGLVFTLLDVVHVLTGCKLTHLIHALGYGPLSGLLGLVGGLVFSLLFLLFGIL
ncbi:hypothetical protein HGRIS_007520 [Hohenbuehelia grisea]|uniref:Uncharacterized protein n=1 Tax=Hohenbuehelia grisea TaxID=104357 RepID=A0ABR3J539_9AGAR